MNRGRRQVGEEIPLTVLTVNAAGTPSFPAAAPHLDIYSSTAKVVEGQLLPVMDRTGVTGLFGHRMRLGGEFSPGRYSVVYRWKVGDYYGQSTDTFEVVAGGHGDGTVIAAHWYERPHADFLVLQLDSGKLVRGKNPTV